MYTVSGALRVRTRQTDATKATPTSYRGAVPNLPSTMPYLHREGSLEQNTCSETLCLATPNNTLDSYSDM